MKMICHYEVNDSNKCGRCSCVLFDIIEQAPENLSMRFRCPGCNHATKVNLNLRRPHQSLEAALAVIFDAIRAGRFSKKELNDKVRPLRVMGDVGETNVD